jgi:GT2 family glycosyltransferase
VARSSTTGDGALLLDRARLNSFALRRDAVPTMGVVSEVTSQPEAASSRGAWDTSPPPTVAGKFLYAGDCKLHIRGVTYGTFRPDSEGNEVPPRDVVAADFRLMAAAGVNAVRTYTVPPRWLLDDAGRNGLRVMVGLAGERYVGYLNDGSGAAITSKLRADVHQCLGHPAILCYAVANEIPASTVRWFGRRRMERFIARLCDAVRQEDPNALVTYVNYPSTEYLQLPFLDLVSFNVFLESPASFAAYLARLQNIAGERPLVMAELGLDSIRNGDRAQAASLVSQIETAFSAGCAGTFVYSWTDEWHRGGEDVEDWAFGLTRRNRHPKPALAAVRDAFAATSFSPKAVLPRVSVVVCSFNGARTLRDCLDGISELDYPDYEVIVVDDGSTDGTSAIAGEYPVRLITTENRGLSSARNTGLEAATGEIVAYIDDDARPDTHWLQYLVRTFGEDEWAAVGGPNLAPATDGRFADCVDNAPGGPIHVLLSDREAEHIPGCNMAFRRSTLQEIGGFDPQFRVAGDDVDVCWRLQAHGAKIGFSPAAVVWHHRRRSLSAYLTQQRGYGAAEPLLARKWPHKYSRGGHVAWGGRLYGKGLTRHGVFAHRWRVYYGSQGTGLFQSIYQPGVRRWSALPLLPEWYLLIAALVALSVLSLAWPPLMFLVAPLLAGSVGALAVQALRSAGTARFATRPPRLQLFKMRALTALLHAVQPAARLSGRLSRGLPSWRYSVRTRPVLPLRRKWSLWTTSWMDSRQRLRELEQGLLGAGARVQRGGDYDRWDLGVEVGALFRARLLMGIEEHGGGAQLVRLLVSPRCSAGALILMTTLGMLVLAAGLNHAGVITYTSISLIAALTARLLWEAALLFGAITDAIKRSDPGATILEPPKHRRGARL